MSTVHEILNKMNFKTLIGRFARMRMIHIYVILIMVQICILSLIVLSWHDSKSEDTMSQYFLLYRPSPVQKDLTAAVESDSNVYSYSKFMNRSNHEQELNITCQEIQYPKHPSLFETWHPVDTDNTAYVFSAYHEAETFKINIIGVKTDIVKSYICQLWYKSDKEKFTMRNGKANVVLLLDSHQRKYSVIHFECLLLTTVPPLFVSVVTDRCAPPLHFLPVRKIKLVKSYKYNFTVCLTPLHLQYSKAYELVEWIELNRILGADHFVFYNYSIAINVRLVLNWYSEQGLVEVIQWKLPMYVDKPYGNTSEIDIHYFGQVAALNDCLMRSKDKSEYIVNIDLDEFIIPHSNEVYRWSEMLQDMGVNQDIYLFRNTFFRKEWDGDEKYNKQGHLQLAEQYRLVTLLKVQRENKIYLPFIRSKYIVRSKAAEHLGTHFIIRMKNYSLPIPISPEKALLHHYRDLEIINDTTERTLDTIVPIKYGSDLIKNVAVVWSSLPHVDMAGTIN